MGFYCKIQKKVPEERTVWHGKRVKGEYIKMR